MGVDCRFLIKAFGDASTVATEKVLRFHASLRFEGCRTGIIASYPDAYRKHIKEVFDRQPKRHTASWLADQLNCDRRNVYNIFSRAYIDTDTLTRISVALNHDFFLDLSESIKNRLEPNPVHES